MLGIIPAAGSASRMQPLGGSKELLPLGQLPLAESGGRNRPGRLRAISEYLVERMLLGGADRICFVVSAEKSDLLRFYAQSQFAERLFFVVQAQPVGLCDAVFRAAPFVAASEMVLLGLPDTIWYPRSAFQNAPRDRVHLITFPVPNPEEFDAVVPAASGPAGRVQRIEVKSSAGHGHPVWGAITAPGHEFLRLADFWRQRGCRDEYLGNLFNAWIASGREISHANTGVSYWDIGTPAGYMRALAERVWEENGQAAAWQ